MLLFILVGWKIFALEVELTSPLAEEVKDAAVVIPWAMVVSYFLNSGTLQPLLVNMSLH